MKLTTMLYDKDYEGGGLEGSVGLIRGEKLVFLYEDGEARFPIDALDWIINSLRMVKYQLELEREERGDKK